MFNATPSYFDDSADHNGRTKAFEDYKFDESLLDLRRYVPDSEWNDIRKTLSEMILSEQPNSKIWNWIEKQKQLHMPRIVGHRPCIQQYTYYQADPMQLPQHGTILKCDDCAK
jgi:hypothetical protein